MRSKKPISSTKKFEKALAKKDDQRYALRLYVSGTTPKSIRAVAAIKDICDEHLKGRYDLEVVDIYQQPVLAEGDQIIAVPTLIKSLPVPLRRLIGDMSRKDQILFGLDIKPQKT